jgi:RNA polymerase sigma-70 factor (ECF subfamily)
VYNVALHYSQQVEDAEEITQDVFLKIHQKGASFRKEAELKTWIYRIAINSSLDYIKAKQAEKRKWWQSALRLEPSDTTESKMIELNHPGIQLENKESLEALFRQINRLAANQKTALILLKVEGLSQAEAADIMEITEKALESLFQRAKKNLRAFLDESEGLSNSKSSK